MWVYILSLRKYYMVTAKALAGWPNARAQVYPPRLEHIFQEMGVADVNTLNNFIDELFGISHPAFLREGLLRIFVETMVASFLRFYSEMLAKYGRNHADLRHFNQTAQLYRLNVVDLSAKVLEDFKFRNAAVQHADIIPAFDSFSTAVTSEMGAIKAQVQALTQLFREEARLRKEEARLRKEVEENLRASQNENSRIVAELLLLAKATADRDTFASSASTPSKRRRAPHTTGDGEGGSDVTNTVDHVLQPTRSALSNALTTPVSAPPVVDAFALLSRASNQPAVNLDQMKYLTDLISFHLNNGFADFSVANSHLPGLKKAETDSRNMCNRVLAVVQKCGLETRLAEWKKSNKKPAVTENRTSWTTSVSELATASSKAAMDAIEKLEKHFDSLQPIPSATTSKLKTPSVSSVDKRRSNLIQRLKKAKTNDRWNEDHEVVVQYKSLVAFLSTG